MLERGVVLEHEADVATLRREGGGVVARDLDDARVGGLEPGDHPQQRRLAATARSEERGERSGRDVDRHVVECDEVAEALPDVPHRDAHQISSFGRTRLSSRSATIAIIASANATV